MYSIPGSADVRRQVGKARRVDVVDVDLSNHFRHLVHQVNTLLTAGKRDKFCVSLMKL